MKKPLQKKKIIPACGYDSIPLIWAPFLKAQVDGPIKRIGVPRGQGVFLVVLLKQVSMGDLKLGKKMNDPYVLNQKIQLSKEQDLLDQTQLV